MWLKIRRRLICILYVAKFSDSFSALRFLLSKAIRSSKSFIDPYMKCCRFPNPVHISKHLRKTPNLGPNSILLKNIKELFWKEGVKFEMQDYFALEKLPEK